jgi:hypothetical protein
MHDLLVFRLTATGQAAYVEDTAGVNPWQPAPARHARVNNPALGGRAAAAMGGMTLRSKRTLWTACAAAALAALAPAASARTLTTHEQTILDRDRDNRLEPAPGDERPHCSRDRQWIREAQFPPQLSWRGFQQFALLGALGNCCEERIDALEALLVHSWILTDCRLAAPVVPKSTKSGG